MAIVNGTLDTIVKSSLSDQKTTLKRSDELNYLKAGIPAVFLRTGYANGGEAASAAFDQTCYHRGCDDLSLPIDYAAAARFARLNYEFARELADAPERVASGLCQGRRPASTASDRTCNPDVCGDLSLLVEYGATARFDRLNHDIFRELVGSPRRPRWNPREALGRGH